MSRSKVFLVASKWNSIAHRYAVRCHSIKHCVLINFRICTKLEIRIFSFKMLKNTDGVHYWLTSVCIQCEPVCMRLCWGAWSKCKSNQCKCNRNRTVQCAQIYNEKDNRSAWNVRTHCNLIKCLGDSISAKWMKEEHNKT